MSQWNWEMDEDAACSDESCTGAADRKGERRAGFGRRRVLIMEMVRLRAGVFNPQIVDQSRSVAC